MTTTPTTAARPRYRCPVCRVIYWAAAAVCVGGWPVYDPARPGEADPVHDPTPVRAAAS